MAQFFFFFFFTVTLLAGAFAYFTQTHSGPIDPTGYIMQHIGYSSRNSSNEKISQQFNAKIDKNLTQLHDQMDDLATQQNRLLDTIRDRQASFRGSGKELSDLLSNGMVSRVPNEPINMTARYDIVQIHQRMDDLAMQQNKLLEMAQSPQQAPQGDNVHNQEILSRQQEMGKDLLSEARDRQAGQQQGGNNIEDMLSGQKTGQINTAARNDIMKIRQRMDDLAVQQDQLLGMVDKQQQVLSDSNQKISDILQEARQSGASSRDILQLQSLSSQIQDEQRHMVDHGKDLIALNDQLTETRQSMADRMDSVNMHNKEALLRLQEHSINLDNKVSEFLDRVALYNEEGRERVSQMRDKVQDMIDKAAYNNAEKQQDIIERVKDMLEGEQTRMASIADAQQRNKDLLADARDRQAGQQDGDEMEGVVSHARSEQINMTVQNGVMQIRQRMQDLSAQQNSLLEMIQNQQQVLTASNRKVDDLLEQARQNGSSSRDILQLQSLASQMQDERRLMINHGRDLIALNDRLAESRELMNDRMEIVNEHNEEALRRLREHSSNLDNKASEFFDKISRYNEEEHEHVLQMRDKVQDMIDKAAYNNAQKQESIIEHIKRMLEGEHTEMARVADIQQKNKDLLQDAQDRQTDSQDLLNDQLQESQDKIDDERQKQQDQQADIQQRIADQQQRMQDSQALRN